MDAVQRARGGRRALYDGDGRMTDGTLFIGPQGEIAKPFNILDGHGLKMLQHAGIACAIISGRSSQAVAYRARELSIEHVVQGSPDKVADFERLRSQLSLEAQACSYMGD